MKTKCILYARKSTDREDKQVLSLQSQIDELSKVAKEKELLIVKTIKESQSAKRPFTRPLFTEMIEDIKNGEAEAILVWSADRLSRNAVDGGTLIQLLDEDVIQKVITPTQEFGNEPMNKLMLQFIMMNAKFENDVKAVNVKRGLKTKLEQGWYPFVAPQGYLNTPDRKKGFKVITKDPKRFNLVRKMWDLLLTGNYTVPQILNIANDEWGFRTVKRRKIGGTKLSKSGLYSIFTNPFYCGDLIVKNRYFKGSHVPMVTKKEFEKAQEILGRGNKPRLQKHEFPFTGMIVCPDCGCAITASRKKKYFPKTNRYAIYEYYHCTRKNKDVKCENPPVRAEDVELQVKDLLKKIEIRPEFKDWAVGYLRKVHEQESTSIGIVKGNYEREINSLQNKLNKLLDTHLNDLIDKDEYSVKKGEIEQELSQLKELRDDKENQADKWLKHVEEAFDFAVSARHKFKEGDFMMKKTILSTIGSNFELKDKKVLFDLKKPYFVFKKAYEGEYNDIERLEPVGSVVTTVKDSFSEPANLSWLLGVDSNHQPTG